MKPSREMNSAAMTPSSPDQLIELTCWICRNTFMGSGKRQNRICDRPRCSKVRNVINGILRREREAHGTEAHCQLCQSPRAEASKYCDRHQTRTCPKCGGNCNASGCTGRVRRNEGQGNQPRHCCRTCRRRSAQAVPRASTRAPANQGQEPSHGR